MMTHANELEKILLAREQIRIIKTSRQDWTIMHVQTGKTVHYKPAVGTCWRLDASGLRKREELRGGPQRIATILEGMIQ